MAALGRTKTERTARSHVRRNQPPPVTHPHAYWSLQSLILREEEEMEMRTSEHSKPEIALECDLIPHSIISYQASELHQKRGRSNSGTPSTLVKITHQQRP